MADMEPTQEADLDAMIEELRASLRSAPPEMRSLVLSQIQSLEQAKGMLERARPQMEANKQYRAPVPESFRPFFTPEQPVQVPAWLPDTLARDEVTEAMMRCQAPARVYEHEDALECAIPTGLGNIPIRSGLSVGFYKSGRLRWQRFYENGCLRWAIEWHPSGGRDSMGFYTDTEPRQHREHGVHTRFAPNGAIVSQAVYWHGTRHGWSKLWEDDGYPISATLYDQGREVEDVLPSGERRRR
ncbi:MAG: hypothetical protein L6Q76_01525 [Polyangiaceae bacterium]|nr:hypothetical protein [Polyangiaceae bacterium]